MHKEGECAASECSLVCNDYLRAGYTNFIVDPGVRLVCGHPSVPAARLGHTWRTGSAGAARRTCLAEPRTQQPGAPAPCPTSELTTTLLQAYKVSDARDLYDDTFVRDVPALDWAAVSQAPPIDRSLSPLRPYYWCCGLKPGHNMIDFDKDCAWDNFMTPNYTVGPCCVAPGACWTPSLLRMLTCSSQSPLCILVASSSHTAGAEAGHPAGAWHALPVAASRGGQCNEPGHPAAGHEHAQAEECAAYGCHSQEVAARHCRPACRLVGSCMPRTSVPAAALA